MDKRAQEVEEKKLLVDQRTQLVCDLVPFLHCRFTVFLQNEADEMAFADAALKSANNKAA